MAWLELGLGPGFRVRLVGSVGVGLGLVLGLEIGCRVRVSELCWSALRHDSYQSSHRTVMSSFGQVVTQSSRHK